jgi:hypothetical protein
MGSRITLWKMAAALLLVAVWTLGCSGPSHKPQEFEGKWGQMKNNNPDVLLTLNADGTGMSRMMYYPSEQSINWVLVGDQLVVNATDGAVTDKYTYAFNGPDKLILTKNGQSQTLVKIK